MKKELGFLSLRFLESWSWCEGDNFVLERSQLITAQSAQLLASARGGGVGGCRCLSVRGDLWTQKHRQPN